MSIVIGIILCITFASNILLYALLYMTYKIHEVQQQQVSEICNIEDSIKSISEYLGEEQEANINQN
tara:strand:+ start:845 stop:1042 length:198 start_codon:yes stop_codon:yes gene_type:complete